MGRIVGRMIARTVAIVATAAALSSPAPAVAQREPTPQPPIVVEVSDGGFHWLDAGIGGAAALAVVLLVVALTLSVRQLGGKP